jgi:hypothetical protein
MPTLLVYPREDLPPDLNWQILSFYRATAPGTFSTVPLHQVHLWGLVGSNIG